MADFHRNPHGKGRLGDKIKFLVADVIENELWLDRKEVITITDLKVSGDSHYVDVYISVFGDDKTVDEVMEYLDKSKGIFHNKIARVIPMRKAPKLVFHKDELMKQVDSFNAKFREIEKRDQELAQLRNQQSE